jgi:hypothetical protein
MRLFRPFFLLLCAAPLLCAQLETRLHRFSHAPPDLVEKQIRILVTEGPRVSMNARAEQVIVIADAATHEKIASMLRELSRPALRAHLKVWHNGEGSDLLLPDGAVFSLRVSRTPPPQVLEQARQRLPPESRRLPAAGSGLEVHLILLREDPPAVRLRVTPAVAFGVTPPSEVVRYEEMSTDLLLQDDVYVELGKAMAENEFYRGFLQTLPAPDQPPRAVGLLISLEKLSKADGAESE